MNILNIIKELYTGKENLVAQLGLFALIGMMTISFNEIISLYTGNTLYAIFSTPSYNETIVFCLIGITIYIFFKGYTYQFVHENYHCESTQLPSISMNCFVTFIKVLPVILTWSLYTFLILYIASLIFMNRFELYIFIIFMLILLPFINMVFVLFAKDFKYELKIFNPIVIANIMKVTFIPVFKFLIQFIIMEAIFIFIIHISLIYSINKCSGIYCIFQILSIICIGSYIQQILNLAYNKGLTHIIKTELNKLFVTNS